MECYMLAKVLNNNVVIAQKHKNQYVLTGKGIGFNYSKGDKIPENKVENVFVKQQNTIGNNYDKILSTVEKSIIGISEEVISFWEKSLNIKLNEAIHVSLPDHVSFAIKRLKEGIDIKNPFLSEFIVLYPKEYEAARKALDIINTRLNVHLPEDEIGFLCLHIKAASSNNNLGDSIKYAEKIGKVMNFIFLILKKEIDKDSLQYARTITHINFMIERVKEGKTVRNYLLDSIKKELYNEYNVAIKVALRIENLFNIKVPEDEIGYIALHLNRLNNI
ncbi:PRD domain-containing protein [Clostridium tetani]|uniref:PRD domain-containing protein n=1 Tax=Clostridium tetani TaxID=1513 RepID=A0ABY0EWI2_CLOTA|nr:PRD domain-containing protein [Clostridium tetani]KHO40344.1 transcription antiterminator BglG [Clostridium tetani]RXI58511.1 PRD domain-containing protein [Clostridium tetani]RXI73223.1 PRD domain-containing protein [Clostridium tetani]